jgi:hypothetical protein
MWTLSRAQKLSQQSFVAFSRKTIRFTIVPSHGTEFIRYFPDDYSVDCSVVLGDAYQYVAPSRDLTDLDLVILTAHGSDMSAGIWDLRRRLSPKTLIAVWFWDNHLEQVGNLRTALAADFIFPSHNYVAEYLINPASAMGIHVPLCCGQWTGEEASRYFGECADLPRSGRLLVNYVDYEFSPRSELLRRLKAGMPEADVLLMEPGDRTRYFDKSRSERFREWAGYKSSLILPVAHDLSTRIFDGLLAGQILLVPKHVADFDAVIPREIQAGLGIIRLADLEIETIRSAAAEAEKAFDSAGAEGVRKRHDHVMGNHMLAHRAKSMLACLKQIGLKRFGVVFGGNAEVPLGLHLNQIGK